MQIKYKRLLVIALAAAAMPAANAATCAEKSAAQSTPQRAVLLELYTSEGCDSCPPADQWLSGKKKDGKLSGVVPLAFHVDYWDRLGWKDRFASALHTERQQVQVARASGRFAYTPQFIKNGSDWRRNERVLSEVRDAGATISMELATPTQGAWTINAKIQSLTPKTPAEMWLAIFENNLDSKVTAGENKGENLHHDFVVRKYVGPIPLAADGRLVVSQALSIDSAWKRNDLGVAVVVQDSRTGDVLQALAQTACAL